MSPERRARSSVSPCVVRVVEPSRCDGPPVAAGAVGAVTLLALRAPAVVLLTSAIADARAHGEEISLDAERLVVELFQTEGRSLVRLARLFVDDRDAAEDIVQEAFLRLARHAGRIESADRAPAYLRSIVLNLARDHNRRGLMSLRHHAAAGRELDVDDDVAEVLARSDEHRRVVEAVRGLPRRQRDCVTLRYFEQLSIPDVASTLGLSPNSVKTHLRRALDALGDALDRPITDRR
jgi:RNA polymerase sigma factor (sigma-70 family)